MVVLFDPIGTGNSTALPANVRSTAPDLLGTRCLVAQVTGIGDFRAWASRRAPLLAAVGLQRLKTAFTSLHMKL